MKKFSIGGYKNSLCSAFNREGLSNEFFVLAEKCKNSSEESAIKEKLRNRRKKISEDENLKIQTKNSDSQKQIYNY